MSELIDSIVNEHIHLGAYVQFLIKRPSAALLEKMEGYPRDKV